MSRQSEEAKKLARHLLDRYFRTMPDYLSRHHLQSYEQFIQADLPRIIRANNPLILYKSQIDPEKKRKTGERPAYEYKVEIYVGGINGTALKIGTPTVALQNGKEIRALFPNEARLRNLTYQSQITADITVRITYDPTGPSTREIPEDQLVQTIEIPDWNMEKVNTEIGLIQSGCGCDYLEDLLTAVFIAHTKVLTAIRVSAKQKKVQITVPKVEHFLFKVLCETSKLLWGSSFLFRENITAIEKQQNYRSVEALLGGGHSAGGSFHGAGQEHFA